ncbi:hypothetical protein XELAEV_18009475mg [Xenopus laevis]|uniref:Uncharacterized protein n=1 Tax=Xenopus laevis TaxID=8355 RepID=A0A974DUJ4_XENLA|nr:hypothetical protein XELAEV_18009475mg [Xenopus laevis]
MLFYCLYQAFSSESLYSLAAQWLIEYTGSVSSKIHFPILLSVFPLRTVGKQLISSSSLGRPVSCLIVQMLPLIYQAK